jgi:hypothetical protein
MVRTAEPVPLAANDTLPVLRLTVRPVGVTESPSLTVPLKPSRLVNVTVDVLVEPAVRLRLAGLAETLKPDTFTVTVTEWVTEPLAAMTVTVYAPAVFEAIVKVEL